MWNNCPPDPVLDTAYWDVSCPAHFLLLHFMFCFWRPRISWWPHSIRQIYPYFFTKVAKIETRREEIYCSFRKRVTPRQSELLLSKIPVYWWEAGFQYDTLMNKIIYTFTLHLISYIFIYRPIYTLKSSVFSSFQGSKPKFSMHVYFPVHATCVTHFIFLNLIIEILSREEFKVWSSLYLLPPCIIRE
jgi:hypothetical protein